MHDDVRDILSRQPNPVERLASEVVQQKTHTGWFADLSKRTDLFLKTGKRIVALECGHYVLSMSLHRAACHRCGEMIRSGYDHDGFRRLGMPDEFSWPQDPLLEINEGGRDEGHSTITRSSPN